MSEDANKETPALPPEDEDDADEPGYNTHEEVDDRMP